MTEIVPKTSKHSFWDRGKEYQYTKVTFSESTPTSDAYAESLAKSLVVETYEIHSGPNLLKDKE